MSSIPEDLDSAPATGLDDPVKAIPQSKVGYHLGAWPSTTEGRQRAVFRLGRWILRYRWLLMLLMSGSYIALETGEHLAHFQGFDFIFQAEFILFALVVPILGGLTLTLLSKAESERAKILYHLDLKHELSLQLNSIRTWDELSNYLVQFPTEIAPFRAVSLYLYRDLTEEFKLARTWSAPEMGDSIPPCSVDAYAIGQQATLFVLTPEHLQNSTLPDNYTVYGLPVAHGKLLIALYLLYLPDQFSLSRDDIRLLTSVVPSIALAIDFLHPSGSRLIRSEATADEQQRLSRYLHDTIAQDLGYLLLSIEHLQQESATKDLPGIQKELAHLYGVTNRAYEQTRDTMAALYPYQEKELAQTMVRRIELDRKTSGDLEINLSTSGEPYYLSPYIQRTILAIYHEALTNCQKHTNATTFDINLSWESKGLTMTLMDNGQGLPVAVNGTSGYGLQIMRQRAAELNGQLTFDSGPGIGTTIKLQVPLPDAA